MCDSEVQLHPFACSQLAVPDPLAERTSAPLERTRMVKAIELGEGLGVFWVSPVPGDPCVAGSSVLYTGLRISYCSPGLDRSLWNLPRGSHDSGLRSGTGDRVRVAISSSNRTLKMGYSLHFGAGVRGLLGTTSSSSLPPPPSHGVWPAPSVFCISSVSCCVVAGASWLRLSEVGSCHLCQRFLCICTEIVSTATI